MLFSPRTAGEIHFAGFVAIQDWKFHAASWIITKIIKIIGGVIMAKCEICGKGVSFGIKVSHSHRRSNRTWKPNVKRVKAIVDGSPKRVYVCTRCLRSGKVTRA